MANCAACSVECVDPVTEETVDERGMLRRYATCPHCGYTWLTPIPTANELSAFYASDYYGAGDRKFSVALEYMIECFRRRRARWVARIAGEAGGPALDIGCGNGRFLAALGAHGFEIHGVELPGPAANRAREVAGLHLHEGPFESADYAPASFDLITMWHVLEHMPKPFEVIEQCRDLLKPGGRLVVDVPNGSSMQARWFGALWFHRDPPRHVVEFNLHALTAIIERTGLQVERTVTRQQEMGLFGFIQSFSNRLIRPRDYFYNLLRSRYRLPGSFWKKATATCLAMLLVVPASLCVLMELVSNRSAVLRVIARKAVV